MSRPVPNPGILEIAPYTPGKSPVAEPGRKVFKLSANETPLGPSPKAVEAYKQAADHLEDYPEGTSRILREAIGRAFGLDPDRIICGAGSDEILNLLAHTYLSHGDDAISTTHGFLVYPIATMANGAINVVAPETNFTADVDAILQRVSPRTAVSRQQQLTSTYLPFDEVSGCAPIAAGCAGARRRLFRYVSRQRLRDRHRLVATTENGDDHTFEDPPASRPCGSAGCSDWPISSMRSIASAVRSTSRPGDAGRRRRSRTPRTSRCRRHIPRSGAPGSPKK
jgi:histidinol-phosphate aminotransferase